MIFDDILVLDNVVYEPIQDALEQMLTSPNLAWAYNPSSLYIKGNTQTPDFPQTTDTFDTPLMTHTAALYDNKLSDVYDLLMPIVNTIPFNRSKLVRLKANLTFPIAGSNQNSHNPVHIDANEQQLVTAVYYVNDSDGDTFIFNEKSGHNGPLSIKQRISPKKGRLVVFNGHYLHAGGIPSQKPRIVVNINIA